MAAPEAKYRALIELAPDPIFIVDLESGVVEEANRAAAELLGYDIDELSGCDLTDIHPQAESDAYVEAFRQTIESGEIRTGSLPGGEQFYLVARDGTRVPVELHATVIELEGQALVVSIARDVTDRRERERALERQNDRLEAFAKVVSHDLRNPLNVAAGRLELARQTGDEGHLETAERALDRMETLIDETLTMARLGEPVESAEPVDLAELLDGCWEMVATSGATLEVDLVGTVDGDPSRLRQLFENLFRNAVEHAGADAAVRVGRTVGGVFVADDGPGVRADRRQAVFEPGVSSAEEGTGFGLAIVESVVSAHGWEIDVTESADGGARFEITGMDVRTD